MILKYREKEYNLQEDHYRVSWKKAYGRVEYDLLTPTNRIKKQTVPILHGFRKFFSSQLVEAYLKTELRWLLEGHNLKGNDSNYGRVTEKRLQQEYEKAINHLTINEENRLKRKIEVREFEKSKLETIAKDDSLLKRKYNKIKV